MSHSDGDRGLDCGMRVVVFDLKILVLEFEDVLHVRVDLYPGKGAGFAAQLELHLIEVVQINMEISKGVDEFKGFEARHLRHHHRQEGVGGNIEGNTQKGIRTPLIELAAQLTLLNIKLKEAVTGRKGHAIDLPHVPGVHNQTPAVRMGLDHPDHIGNLIDRAPVRSGPGTPLFGINRAELPPFIRPFVPNRDAVILEILNIGVPLQEPEKFIDDRFEMDLFGRQEGETVIQIKTHLITEGADCSHTRTVFFLLPIGEDVPEKGEIWLHKIMISQKGARPLLP